MNRKLWTVFLIAALNIMIIGSGDSTQVMSNSLHPDHSLSNVDSTSNGEIFINATYGWDSYDYGDWITKVEDGYVFGGTTGSLSGGVEQFWLGQTDASGVLQWNKTYGYPVNPIYLEAAVQCSDGGYLLLGQMDAGDYDVILLKTDSSGNYLWNQTFGGIGDDYPYDLVETEDGGFAIAISYYNDSSSYWDFMIYRTDLNGTQLWNSTFGGYTSDVPYSIILDDDGGFVLGGYTASFGEGNADMWILKTNSSGHHLWNYTYGASDWDYMFDMVKLSDGGFGLVGRRILPTESYTDVWLAVTDSEGIMLWNKTYDNAGFFDGGEELVEMPDGGFTIAGSTALEGGEAPSFLWYIRTNPSGDVMWNYTLDGESFNPQELIYLTSGGIATIGKILIGPGNIDANIFVIPELMWVEKPMNQVISETSSFSYDVDAISVAGISSWDITGSTSFGIDGTGLIENTTLLSPGEYDLEIIVEDNVGNVLEENITVTVLEVTETTSTTTSTTPTTETSSTTSPSTTTSTTTTSTTSTEGIPIETLLLLAGGAGLVLVIVIVVVLKRKK